VNRQVAGTVLCAYTLVACSGKDAAVETPGEGMDSIIPVAFIDTVVPEAGPGFLAARTPDPGAISGEWPGRAGECADPPSLQLLVDGDSVGVLVVLGFPDSGPRVGSYPISPGELGWPRPGTARMGVQRILYVGLAYGAMGGSVELSRVDRGVSGRFDVRLVEATTEREVRYLGTFRDVPLGSWPADLCVMTLPPDSAAADSSR